LRLCVISSDGQKTTTSVEPTFFYPHSVHRKPPFRFLSLPEYYKSNQESAAVPADKQRQDGIFLMWDTEKITAELSDEQREAHKVELDEYSPQVYAFLPYSSSVWGDLNQITTDQRRNRTFFSPGLMIGVNRQRLADVFEIETTRFTYLGFDVMVLVHFDNARPDLGRKTLQAEVLDLAKSISGRIVLYLARQRAMLRDRGESPTPGQRETEQDHEDWKFNVRDHAQKSPLHVPPVSLRSTPLTEQDVVGLFNQLSALGLFIGLQIFATSQGQTYDCLVQYDCPVDNPGLRYVSASESCLGVSPFVLGHKDRFKTRPLTLEFKNNLDGLIGDVADAESKKSFSHIDICVCWGEIDTTLKGFALDEITESNIDQRKYPGVTHLLRKENESHVVQVIMLETVINMVIAGRIQLA
jgi:hypothetical protein